MIFILPCHLTNVRKTNLRILEKYPQYFYDQMTMTERKPRNLVTNAGLWAKVNFKGKKEKGLCNKGLDGLNLKFNTDIMVSLFILSGLS